MTDDDEVEIADVKELTDFGEGISFEDFVNVNDNLQVLDQKSDSDVITIPKLLIKILARNHRTMKMNLSKLMR